MPADKPTELSRIKLKTWTRQPVPMISKHSAHSTSLPFGFLTWIWRYTCLLLLKGHFVCKQSDISELYYIRQTNTCAYWEVRNVIHLQYVRNCIFNLEKSAAPVRDGQEMETLRQGSIDPISHLTADSWVALNGNPTGCWYSRKKLGIFSLFKTSYIRY